MPDPTPHDQDLLNTYWDALVRGEKPAPSLLDPEAVALIARLQALYQPPPLDQQLRTRFLDDLVAAASVPVPPSSLVILPPASIPPAMNGTVTADRSHWLPPAPDQLSRGRRATFTAIAILVFVLAAASLPFITSRLGSQTARLVTISALDAPVLPPLRAPFTVTPLLELVIPTATSPQAWVQLDHYTFPPDATLMADSIDDETDGEMADVFYVAEGAAEVVAGEVPQPVRVIRAGGKQAEDQLGSQQTATLVAGDAVVIPEDGAISLHNATTSPTIVVHLLQSIYVSHPTDPDIDYQSLVGKIRNLQAPVTVALDQVTLAPGAVLPGPDRPGITQLAAPIDLDRAADALVESDGATQNLSETPLDLYVLRVSSSVPS